MQQLHKPGLYPPRILAQIKAMPPLATEISNRWMLGWPQATKELLKSGRYLEALKAQEQQEREVLSEPGNSHLARHEIVQEFGLSLSPPTF